MGAVSTYIVGTFEPVTSTGLVTNHNKHEHGA